MRQKLINKIKNKIDINKLEVKSYTKGSYLIIKYFYKNSTYKVKAKRKFQAVENIKINNEFINNLLISAETIRKEVDFLNHNLKLYRITINGYVVWAEC